MSQCAGVVEHHTERETARDKKSLPARTHTRTMRTHTCTHKCSMTNEEDTIQVPAHLYLFVFSIL